jgi:hypothetical protein
MEAYPAEHPHRVNMPWVLLSCKAIRMALQPWLSAVAEQQITVANFHLYSIGGRPTATVAMAQW